MQNRLDEIQARYFEIEKLMSQNDIASDPNSIRKLGREYSQLQTIVDLWSDINQNEKNLNETKEIIKEETDPDVIEMAREEAQLLEEKILFELPSKLWKNPCNMLTETEETKKEILNHCGYRESMMELEPRV